MPSGWYGLLLDRWDALRGSYWFVPGLITGAAGLAALALIEVDRRGAADGLEALPWLRDVSAPAARSVLSTIAGSMITVTGVVFSITIVALTLASSQFGPRLLRTFLRDRGSQLALGAFLATFVFNLLVLRAVETSGTVPVLATAVAVLLALTSLFVLIYFVHHTASSIQASSVIAAVAAEIEQQLPTLFPERIGDPGPGEPASEVDRERLARVESDGDPVRARCEGYLRVIDRETLLATARERDLLLRVRARPGDFLTEGAIVAQLVPGAHASEADRSRLEGSFLLGSHRTPVQDLAFLIDQLEEMAVRALSPGVNDPRTAVACVQRLGGVLARLASRSLPSGRRLDADGRLRVVADPTRFDEVAASCFDAIRRHGAHDAQVAAALLDALAAGAGNAAQPDRRGVLEEHAAEIRQAFAGARGASKRDRDRVQAAYDRALRAFDAAQGSGDPPSNSARKTA